MRSPQITAQVTAQATGNTKLIVVPTAAGYPGAAGLRLGPEHILAQLHRLASPLPEIQHIEPADDSVPAVKDAVAATAARAASSGYVPVVVGGDHTVALGGIVGVRDGLRRRRGRDVPLFLLWLDAHPDVNTAETSPTGNLHGMVLSGLLGQGPLALASPLPPDRIVLAGVRSFDPGEFAFLQARPEMACWDVRALRTHEWSKRAGELLARVEGAGGRLYVSLDLDVVDPTYAPGVAVPVRHGARPDSLFELLRRLRASGFFVGADVVELYPPADRDSRTARLAVQALGALGAITLRPRYAETPSDVRPAA
ncbi:MAG: arginase family protein [Chloroflexi bacterium]|nr:arginase family protein [Chloroflexota bacterium]